MKKRTHLTIRSNLKLIPCQLLLRTISFHSDLISIGIWFWFQVVPGFRVRIIPVLGPLPAIFGQVMASYVLTEIAGLCVKTEPVVNLDADHYRILHQRLLEHEEALYGSADQVLVYTRSSIFHDHMECLISISLLNYY